MKAMMFWTIGHSTLELEAFIEILHAHQIEAVADVRMFPGSRRYPQFNREVLVNSLADRKIEYHHFPELGGRRRPIPDSPNNAWRNESFRGYADYMMNPDFTRGIERLDQLGARKRTALMCAESLWWRCHRALISDHLKSNGLMIQHILSAVKTEEHPYTSAARIVDGRLSYRVAAPLELALQ